MQIGPLSVVLESDEPTVLAKLTPLFSGFADGGDDSVRTATISVVDAGDGDGDGDKVPRYRATFEGETVGGRLDQYQLEVALTRKLNRAVLDAEDHLLHLHAGAVSRDDATVMVIGSSFAGKSTLVAKLVTEGWRYLSDEQVGVTALGELVPFQRPITLRRDSWPFFDQLDLPFDHDPPPDRVEVSPGSLGEVHRAGPTSPTVIVRPDVSTEQFGIEQLSAAETLELLVADSLDMLRSADAGLQSMLTIIAHAPSYRIYGTDLDKKCRAIADVCLDDALGGQLVETERIVSGEESIRTAGTYAWLWDDGSSALYEPESGALVRLDEPGFRAWQLFAAPLETWPAGLAESEFAGALRDAGVLAAPDE